jgi:pimeloyl-ACP methyl ester carboxylesterase
VCAALQFSEPQPITPPRDHKASPLTSTTPAPPICCAMRRAFTVCLIMLLLGCAAQPPDDPPMSLTTVHFDTGPVAAIEYGNSTDCVILAHGGRFTKESWDAQARTLARAGFHVFAINLHQHPELGVLEYVRHLRAKRATSVSVIGASYGGGAAAEASVLADEGEIDRIVLLAHSSIKHPELMKGRKLFIVARDDPYADGTPRLASIQDQNDRAPGPKELVVLEGDAHAQFIFDTDQGARLMDEILRFLQQP